MQLYKYLDILHARQKNDIFPVHLFYLRIFAAHKLPTRVSYQLLHPASTHVGRIYPRLVGMRVQKGHLYSGLYRDFPNFIFWPILMLQKVF